jgi:hypothetical protein
MREIWRFGVEQVIVVIIGIATLALQLRYGLVHRGDWKPSVFAILWPYFGLVALFIVYQFIHVPSLLYTELQTALARSEESLRAALKSVSLSITIEAHAKEPVDRKKGATPSHVFVHAKIELKEPNSVEVTNYKLELLKHGACESLDSQKPNDVGQWEAMEWALDPANGFNLTPLAYELRRGEPIQGWLRFVSETPTKTMMECRLRLIAQTREGSGYGEIAPDKTAWNRNQAIFSLRRRD